MTDSNSPLLNSTLTNLTFSDTKINRNDIRIDENLASLFFGWSLAMIVVVLLRLCSTIQYRGQLKLTTYIILCSALLAVSAALASLSWLYLINSYRPGQVEMAAFLTLWSLSAQVYFQLVITRILVLDMRQATKLRLATFAANTGINIMMFSLWLPQVLVTHDTPSSRVFWMPRIEKVLLLGLDLAMNIYFLRLVKIKLLASGFAKYRNFVHYNYKIVILSLACDCLLLGIQWYPRNDVIFVIIHPVLFLNKLVLEMSICERMAQSSRSTEGVKLNERVLSPVALPPWRLEPVIDSPISAKSTMAMKVNSIPSPTTETTGIFVEKDLPVPPLRP